MSQIAPTVAQPDDHVDYGVPWQELTRTAGRIVGQADEAEQLVPDEIAELVDDADGRS